MTRQRTEVPIEVEELHTTISELSGEVSRLEDKKKELEDNLVNPSVYLEYYLKHQDILTELKNEIENKKGIIQSHSNEISSLGNKKSILSRELSSLETVVNEKKTYISDIEKYKKSIVILQQEISDFKNKHEENKKIAQAELKDITDKIQLLKNSIANVTSVA